jgi:glycosyltransferase involved in cell wall biosynthesis
VKVLIGIVCDAAGIAPATVTSVIVRGLSDLAAAGHQPHLQVIPAAGNPDAARCLLSSQAMAGRFDVLLLADSGVWCERTAVLDLCEAAHRRGTVVGTLLPPVVEADGGKFLAVSQSLMAVPVDALEMAAAGLLKIEQGFYPIFVGGVRDVCGKRLLCPSGWTFCLDRTECTGRLPEVLVGLRAEWSMPAVHDEEKGGRVAAREMAYPIPKLPVSGYLAELQGVADGLRPDGDRPALTEPPRAIEYTGPRRPGKVKVALVNTCMLAGGAERQTCTLAAGMDKGRFDVAVINANPEQGTHRPLAEMLRAAEVPCYSGGDHPSIDAADVVLWWGPALSRRIKSGRFSKPSIHVCHSDSHWTARAMLECEGAFDRVVAVSGPAAAMAAGVLGRGVEEIPVIWNGIDPAELGERPTTPRHGSGDDFTIGWLGRISDEKNPISVISALAQLPSRFKLAMWGGGPLAGFAEIAAAELGVSDRVRFMGVAEDRGAALAQMDCLVLASLFEGLPLTVIEAMHYGVPVIAPPWGDLPLVLGSPSAGQMERRGFLIEPTASAIAGDVELLVAFGPDRLAEIVSRARSFAAEHFTVDRMVASYSALFEELACRS